MALGDGDAWDETTPNNSTLVSDGDDHIRDVRKGIRIRLEYEHATLAGSSAGGKHKFITLQAQGSKPTVDATQVAAVYVKDVGAGVMELFYEDEAGTEVQITSGTSLTSAVGGVSGSAKNLAVSRSSATAIAFTADEVVMSDTSNNKVNVYSVSESVDITNSGASGLDTGAEAANTLYYIWLIRKSSDATINGMISLSATAPTMPSGYDQKALLSVVGNDNSSNFIPFHQNGREYTFDVWATMASANPGTGSWTSIDMTPANMSTNAGFVPSALSNMCFGSFYSNATNAAIANDSSVATGITDAPNKLTINTATLNAMSAYWKFNILTTDTLYYLAGATSTVYLHGFTINKLGV